MSEEPYDDEWRYTLRDEIDRGAITVEAAEPYFLLLEKRYPVFGAKIDWSMIPDSIEDAALERDAEVPTFLAFFRDIVHRSELAGPAALVGDGLTSIALVGELSVVADKLEDLLSTPQHNYLLARDAAWCFAFTMEGDMAFGFAPPAS